MRFGVLGSGAVGTAIGHGLATLGHSVMMGSREPGNPKAAAFAAAHPPDAAAGSFAEAAAFGEALVVAVKGTALAGLAAAAGPERCAGKVVIDATNPLDFSRGFADLAIRGADSGGETLQRLLPEARIVKTLNTVNNRHMFRPRWSGGVPDMYLAGNDPAAKAEVAALLRDFGWNPVDLGGITSARWLEAMCIAWVEAAREAGGYDHAFKLIRLG